MFNNTYSDMLIVQRRITILMIDDRIKRWNSSDDVSGVLVGFSNAHSLAIIALDIPTNTAPNHHDILFADTAIYNNNIKQTLTLPLRYWDIELIVTHCQPIEETIAYMLDSTTDKSDKLVYCQICKKAVPMNRSIVTCEKNHHICCKNHIIPFNEKKGKPDIKITKSIEEEFKRRFGIEIPYQQTCMLLLYEDCKDQRKELKDKMFEEYSYNDSWKCAVCRNERSVIIQDTLIEFLHIQLFPECAVNRVNDFKSLQNSTLPNDQINVVLLEENFSNNNAVVKNDSSLFSKEMSHSGIDIILNIPSNSTSLQFKLFPNLSYFEIKEKLLSNTRFIPSQMDLYKQVGDYCVLIVDEGDRNRGVLSVSDIRNNDNIVLHNAYYNIGIPVKLSTCLYQHKDINNTNEIRNKLDVLEKFYESLRCIKNDCNNYYNAVMVAYIEIIICSNDRQKLFNILYHQIRSILSKDYHNSRLVDFLNRILEAAAGKIWLTVTDFEVDILTGGGWYSMLALSSRRILSKFIQRNPNISVNGLTVREAVSSSFGLSDLDLFCNHYIGLEINAAPQIVTHLGLLPLALNISCTLITYNNIIENSLEHTLQTPISFDGPPYVNINLIEIRDSYYVIYPIKRAPISDISDSDISSNHLVIMEDINSNVHSSNYDSKLSTLSNVTTQTKQIESNDNRIVRMNSNNSNNSNYSLNANLMSKDYLTKDIKVFVYFVEMNQISPITLKIFNSFDDVVRSICQLLHINTIKSSTVLHVIDSQGWSVEIASNSQSGYVTINELQENDVITVRKLVEGNVGPRMSIETVSQNEINNPVLTKKYQNLSNQYIGLRKIRGDGNCYYRAIIVGLLEHIVKSKDKSKFSQLRNRLKQAQFSDAVKQNNHLILLSILKKASLGECFLTWEEVESKLLDDSVPFDKSLIVACRKLVAQYIVEHEDEEMNGLALKDWISSCYEVSSMREYCQKYVNMLGEDAEGPLVELGLLPRALGCYCTIVYLDRISGNDLMSITQQVDSNDESDPLGNIHLLLKPGHYDLLYEKSTFIRHDRELLISSLVKGINAIQESQSSIVVKIDEEFKSGSQLNINVGSDTNSYDVITDRNDNSPFSKSTLYSDTVYSNEKINANCLKSVDLLNNINRNVVSADDSNTRNQLGLSKNKSLDSNPINSTSSLTTDFNINDNVLTKLKSHNNETDINNNKVSESLSMGQIENGATKMSETLNITYTVALSYCRDHPTLELAIEAYFKDNDQSNKNSIDVSSNSSANSISTISNRSYYQSEDLSIKKIVNGNSFDSGRNYPSTFNSNNRINLNSNINSSTNKNNYSLIKNEGKGFFESTYSVESDGINSKPLGLSNNYNGDVLSYKGAVTNNTSNLKISKSNINNITNEMISDNTNKSLNDILTVFPNVSRVVLSHYIEIGIDGYEAASLLSRGHIPTSTNICSSSKSRSSTSPSYTNNNTSYLNSTVSQEIPGQMSISKRDVLKLKDQEIEDMNILDLRKICITLGLIGSKATLSRLELEKRLKEFKSRNKFSK